MKDLSHIKMFEGKKEFFGYFKDDLVCLYNSENITLSSAIACFERELYNDNVIVMTKQQWIQLFCNGVAD